MKESLTYQNVVEELLARVPAFAAVRLQDKSSLSHDDKSPYLVFGDFGRFLRDRMRLQVKGAKDESILRHSFELLDEMLTSTDPEVANLAQVGVFEVLADEPDALTNAKQYLKEDAKSILERWMDKWLTWLRQNKEL